MNALMKLAKSTESGDQATMFITHAPCMDCAKGIYQAGIKSIYYRTSYRDSAGVEFLEKCGVKIEKVEE
jgi:dCMP deaminase